MRQPVSPWLVFGYNTPDEIYRHFIALMVESARRVGLDVETVEVPPAGDWLANINQKPAQIRAAMERHPDRDILYADADSRFWTRPPLLDSFASDFGVCYLGADLLSGVLFLRNRPQVRALVDRWAAQIAAEPHIWDQGALQTVLERDAAPLGVKWEKLPPGYCYIRGLTNQDVTPVIFQHQASCIVRKVQAGMTLQAALAGRGF